MVSLFPWRESPWDFLKYYFQYGAESGRGNNTTFYEVGSFDVDDILLNTIGGVLGYILFVVCSRIRRKRYVRKGKKKGRR